MSCYLRYLKKTCDLKNKYFYEMIAFSNILKCINMSYDMYIVKAAQCNILL